MGKNEGLMKVVKIVVVEIVFILMLVAMPVGADSGLPGGIAKIKDWDQAHEAFNFSLGEVTSEGGDFFIAVDRIYVFDSPGIIDMGDIPLADIKEAPESGYKETAKPIEAHSYVIRSHGKYGKIRIEDIFNTEDYEWISVAEYEFDWVYQPDGMRSFGVGEAPGEPATQVQTGTGGEYECPRDAQQAYQQYMAAYNSLATLMAKGKGDTPEAQEAYKEYAAMKACYENKTSGIGPSPTLTLTPTSTSAPTSTLNPVPMQTPQQTGCTQFEVPPKGEWARESWFNTHVNVTSGQMISINASGTVQPSTSRDLFCGPDGTFAVGYWLKDYSFRSDWGHGALIARIGAAGTPIFIGNNTTFTTPTGGEVWLGVNDIDPGNNAGEFVVEVCLGQASTSTDGEQQRLYPVADGDVYAYSYLNWNWANWGMYKTMGAGWHPVGGERRAYLRFDLPAGLDISRAVLKLYQYQNAGPVHTLGVYRVKSSWDEGTDTYHSGEVEEKAAPGELCWMQQPSFDPVPVATFTSATTVPTWIEVDITSLVQQWQDGTRNYGLVVKTTNEHPTSSDPEAKSGFYTKEHPDHANRPVLELSLTTQAQQLRISDLRGTLNTDNDCNLYVADWGDNQVKMINPDGSASSYTSGIDRPRYQIFDQAGNLYMGSFDGNIYQVSASGKKTVVASGIWSPQGMGFDSDGNLYVAGGYDGKIHRIAPDGSKTAMDSGFTYPKHLAVKTDGNVYVVGNSGTIVLRITPGGDKANLVDINETILGMATDGEYLYVSHSDKISRIDSFGQVTQIATDLDQPSSLTVCSGNVFVTVRDGIVKM